MARHRKRVIVGLSGSAASAVTLLLLKNQGYDVRALHLRVDPKLGTPKPGFIYENAEEAIRRFTQKFEIPLQTKDVSAQFDAIIFEGILHAQLGGRGFSPQFAFFTEILFPELELERIRYTDALIASGHSAKITEGCLNRSQYPQDDSSAWLGGLTRETRERLFLPLGDFSSAMVETLGLEMGVPQFFSANRAQAQTKTMSNSVYFSGDDFRQFIPPAFLVQGSVLSVDQFSLETHPGIYRYQRGDTLPTFPDQRILEIHPESRNLIIGPVALLAQKTFWIENLKWAAPHSEIRTATVEFQIPGESSMGMGSLIPFEGDFGQATLEVGSAQLTTGLPIVLYQESQAVASGTVLLAANPDSSLSKGTRQS